MEKDRSNFKILTVKHIRKILLGRPRNGWEDNIKIYLEAIGVSTKTWVHYDTQENNKINFKGNCVILGLNPCEHNTESRILQVTLDFFIVKKLLYYLN